MAKNSCKLIYPHEVTGIGDSKESILHNKLKETFPGDIDSDGNSIHYSYVLSENFKERFGDWTNPDTYQELLNRAENTTVFNQQGEPNLHMDLGLNSGYFLTVEGKRIKLNEEDESLTSLETQELVNSLTGEYITEGNIEIDNYVDNKFSSAIKKLESDISEQKELLDSEMSEEDFNIQLQIVDNLEKDLQFLELIFENENITNSLKKKIITKLEKVGLKYTEDAADKEDKMTMQEDVHNFIRESNEVSNRAINDVEILKFLSSVPLFQEYNPDVTKQTPILNELVFTNKYMPQSHVWDILESTFSDIIQTPGKEAFDKYIEELELLVDISEDPSLNYILNYLKNNADYNFKVKFFSAFHKARQNYSITQVTKGRNEFKVSIIDPAEVNSSRAKIASNYIEDMEVANLDYSKIKDDLQRKYEKIASSSNPKVYIDFINNDVLNQLNISTHPKTVEFLVKKLSINTILDVNRLIEQLILNKNYETNSIGDLGILYDMQGLKQNVQNDYKDILKRKRSFFGTLADADSLFKRENSEATVMVGGNQRWLYSYVSGLKRQILNWKAGDLSSLEQLQDRNLIIVDRLLKDPSLIQDLEVYTNSEIKQERDSNPVLHKRITEPDLHFDLVTKQFHSLDDVGETERKAQGVNAAEIKRKSRLKNYLTYNFGADKNSLFSLYGLPTMISDMANLYDYENQKIGSDMKKVLNNYMLGELKRINSASNDVVGYFNLRNKEDKIQYQMEFLIPDYHYKTKKDLTTELLTAEDFNKGEYLKPGIFTSSFNKFKRENNIKIFDIIEGANILNPSLLKGKQDSIFSELMGQVYNDFNQFVKEDIDYLADLTIIDRENEEGEREQVKLFDINTNVNIGTEKQRIARYILNSFMANYELSNIFNGHPSFYKQSNPNDQNLEDFFKRAPAIQSDGLYPYIRQNAGEKTYITFSGEEKTISNKDEKIVVAVVNNIEVDKSKFADEINKGRNNKGKTLTYEHEIADAQGFITQEHFKDLVTRIYGWSDYDTKMYDELTNPKHKVTDDNIRWIKKFSKAHTPLKMVHYEINDKGQPIYLKYSVAALFDAITNGTEVQKLKDSMNKQGVEQVVFKSGSKASNATLTSIHKMNEDGSYGGLLDDIKLNPFEISTANYKMQVQLPTKLDGSISLGNQAIKNILVNMDITNPEKAYTYRGNKYTAKEMHDIVNEQAREILDRLLNSESGVLNKLGYNRETGEFDTRKIKSLLLNQLDKETEADLISLLETDLPLETIPGFVNRAYPVISAFIRKNAGKIYTNGASAVQVANIGFDRLTNETAKQVFFFNNKKTELTPPLPKYDNQGNIVGVTKAKILLPFSSIFDKTGMSYEDFIKNYKAKKIDKRIFQNVIGYRIPNQAVSSNDSFEIVGILPPIAGDQAIVYHEITAKTGSDFDIDKMYLMTPNFDVEEDYVLYTDNDRLRGRQNKLIEALGSILEAPVSYDDLVSPLDNKEMIKGSIEEVLYQKALKTQEISPEVSKEEFLNSRNKTGMQQLLPVTIVKARTEVLEAKSLISIMANNMTDLGLSQKANFALKYPIGFKRNGLPTTSLFDMYQIDKEGNIEFKISKIVSYLMNAAVDAAKDSYIIQGNFNTYTANPAMLMVRMGVPMEDIFTILLNDTIVDLSRDKNYAKAKISDFVFPISQDEMNEHTKSFLLELNQNDMDIFKVISREDFLTNNRNKKELILGFWNLLSEIGKEMNEAVVMMKSDANSAGQSVSDFISLSNRMEKVLTKSTIQNSARKWFTDSIGEDFSFNPDIAENKRATFLGAMANNTMFLMNDLASNLFLELSPKSKETLEQINKQFGRPLDDDSGRIKLIYNYLYPSILYSTGHKVYNIDEIQEKYLIDTFPKELAELKQAFPNNAFLKELFIRKGFINFPNYKNFSSEEELAMKEGFTEIMDVMPIVADLFVQYNFVTTGFRPKIYSYRHLLPASYFIDSMHGKTIQKTIDKFSEPKVSNIDLERSLMHIAKTNSDNYLIVKKLSKKDPIILSGDPIIDEKLLDKLKTKSNSFVPFIKKGKSLYFLSGIENGSPIYEFMNSKRQLNHDVISFNNLPEGLKIQDIEYKSNVEELYKNLPSNNPFNNNINNKC